MTSDPTWHVEDDYSHSCGLLLVFCVLTSSFQSHRVFEKQCTDESDLPPCQIRKTYPEAICTAYGHNSKWQVHIRSKNPKWVPDTFSVRPSGFENIDSPLKLTCLLSYYPLATVAYLPVSQLLNLQKSHQLWGRKIPSQKSGHLSACALDNHTKNWEFEF